MATNLDITPGPTKNREVPHCTLDRMNKKYSKFSYNPAHWTPKAVVECRCRESMSENWLLDGYSRLLVHWDLRESMTEADIETILERAKERYPGVRPRVISDNGPQFIAKGFKEFIRISGMTHVRTSPYYPQSNSKIERWHKSLIRRVHPAGNATVAGRCAASGGGLRRALQQHPPEQCSRLHHPEGHARRASAGAP